jgi:hypothetical protein
MPPAPNRYFLHGPDHQESHGEQRRPLCFLVAARFPGFPSASNSSGTTNYQHPPPGNGRRQATGPRSIVHYAGCPQSQSKGHLNLY